MSVKDEKHHITRVNRLLIPVSGKTVESLGLLAFDPEGVFSFVDNRWLKVYEVSGTIEQLADVVKWISGRIRITLCISESGGVTCHLTLMEMGDTYDEVRRKIENDEEQLEKVCHIRTMGINEVMQQIAAYNYQKVRFSYASYVRGKRDWKRECFAEPVCAATEFEMYGIYGEALNALEFSEKLKYGLFDQLKRVGCAMYLTIDLNCLSEKEQDDFKRALEKKYNRRLADVADSNDINLSLSAVILCDSNDAKRIVEETVIAIFLKHGVVLTSSFRNQKNVLESTLSLGLTDSSLVRTVDVQTAKMVLGGVLV